MSNLIVGEQVYKTIPEQFDWLVDSKELEKIASILLETCTGLNGLGLSCPQIGINKKIFTIKTYSGYKVYINPRIVNESDDLAKGTEVCLSFPGIAVKIVRPYSIRVRYQNLKGETKTENLEGGEARLFQHEMTHMTGRLFWEDSNFIGRSKAIKDWKQIKRRLNRLSGALPPAAETNDKLG